MLADKPALIGSRVSEEDQVVTLLGSLTTSFATRYSVEHRTRTLMALG